MLEWIRDKCDLLRRTMADVGNCEAEATARLKDYSELAHAATVRISDLFFTVGQIGIIFSIYRLQ